MATQPSSNFPEERKKKRIPLHDIPSTPVSSLSMAIYYLIVLAEAEQAAATYDNQEPPEDVAYTVGCATSLINSLLLLYGNQMTSTVRSSLETTLGNLSGAQSFETINLVLHQIQIPTNVNLYSAGQTASSLALNALQNISDSGQVNAFTSLILANIPPVNQDGLTTGSPSLLSSIFPINYPDTNDLSIFSSAGVNTVLLAQELMEAWVQASAPSNAGLWLEQGAGAIVVKNYLNPVMNNLGTNPSAAQLQVIINMVDDLGDFFDTINKDLDYELPNYGPSVAQFSTDLKNYDGIHTTVQTLQNDYTALVSAFT